MYHLRAVGHCVIDSLWPRIKPAIRTAGCLAEVAAPPRQPDDFVMDKLKLLTWALVLVLTIAAIVIGVDVLFGRK